MPHNADTVLPPSQSARCTAVRKVFVLEDQLREEKGMKREGTKGASVWGGYTPLYSWLHRSAARAEGSPDERNERRGLVVIW